MSEVGFKWPWDVVSEEYGKWKKIFLIGGIAAAALIILVLVSKK